MTISNDVPVMYEQPPTTAQDLIAEATAKLVLEELDDWTTRFCSLFIVVGSVR